MQKILVVVLGLISVVASANAASGIDQVLPSITARVLECSILPYTVDASGIKTQHALVSHCADVKVVSPGHAEIKVAAGTFHVSLKNSPDADGGDLNDVTIQNIQTGEHKVISNVLSYGDVLLGVLGGDTSHVFEKLVTDASANSADANVLR